MTPRDRVDAGLVLYGISVTVLAVALTFSVWDARRLVADQGLADRYAVQLDHGRSHAVEWAVCVGRAAVAREAKDVEAEGRALRCWQQARQRAMDEWLPGVYAALERDFGRAIAEHWKLGAQLSALGTSERSEHQARLLTLDQLVMRMRDGTLRRGAAR